MLCLGGSLREGSLSTAVLEHAAALARERGARAALYTVHDMPGLYRPGVTRPDDPGVAELRDAVAAATCLLVVTPVYGGMVSGAVKNLLDTLHLFKGDGQGALSGRRVVVGAVGGGALQGRYEYQPGATMALEIACQNLGGWVSPRHLELSELMFDADGRLVDELARDALRTAVAGLVAPRTTEVGA
ncbi:MULTISPECIES: NADPH-dependent FMN reductase [Cellulomonas]|uniref:NADPH-dependent FMN reductase n=1 Tax=Cellulomonas TaxID=1707 RepID=UPI001FE3A9C5|nr:MULTISPECIES: NAD(P)H-dependent oxidoreductase [Cellulomonas]